jgi:hypothetical protein
MWEIMSWACLGAVVVGTGVAAFVRREGARAPAPRRIRTAAGASTADDGEGG